MARLKGYKIKKSPRKNKEFVAVKGDKEVHFADPSMTEFPGTRRGLARKSRFARE